MKKDTHPQYHEDARIVCACGNTFTTGSTVQEMHVEMCSHCHPFYTGKQKVVDTQRRVERFNKMLEKKKVKPAKKTKQKQKKDK